MYFYSRQDTSSSLKVHKFTFLKSSVTRYGDSMLRVAILAVFGSVFIHANVLHKAITKSTHFSFSDIGITTFPVAS